MNFYIQVYYINFYAIKFLLYEKYGMLHWWLPRHHPNDLVVVVYRHLQANFRSVGAFQITPCFTPSHSHKPPSPPKRNRHVLPATATSPVITWVTGSFTMVLHRQDLPQYDFSPNLVLLSEWAFFTNKLAIW